jgi:hypothetical protein
VTLHNGKLMTHMGNLASQRMSNRKLFFLLFVIHARFHLEHGNIFLFL